MLTGMLKSQSPTKKRVGTPDDGEILARIVTLDISRTQQARELRDSNIALLPLFARAPD